MPQSQTQYQPERRPLNVLAIDGGGVRGLSSLLILKQVMEQLQPAVDTKSVLLPWQIFDIICGTSTGGLIAIMLGRLRMSVDEAIKHYRALCKRVFGSPRLFGGLRNKAFGTPMYRSSILKKRIRMIVKRSDAAHRNGEALLHEPVAGNPGGVYCHTFVVATRKAQAAAPPELFKSYAPEGKYKIWESARATTATSEFFDPVEICAGAAPSIAYLDANLVANNPSEIACREVQQLFPGRPIGCFLSLGTGLLEVIQLKGNLIRISNACKKIARECETVADRVEENFRMDYADTEDPYFRFSVNRGLEDIKLSEWTQERTLAGVTSAYMRFHEQDAALKRCVKALKPKAEWIIAQRENSGAIAGLG